MIELREKLCMIVDGNKVEITVIVFNEKKKSFWSFLNWCNE